jgi:hypothetical protein
METVARPVQSKEEAIIGCTAPVKFGQVVKSGGSGNPLKLFITRRSRRQRGPLNRGTSECTKMSLEK